MRYAYPPQSNIRHIIQPEGEHHHLPSEGQRHGNFILARLHVRLGMGALDPDEAAGADTPAASGLTCGEAHPLMEILSSASGSCAQYPSLFDGSPAGQYLLRR
jgi:hypothetical protein